MPACAGAGRASSRRSLVSKLNARSAPSWRTNQRSLSANRAARWLACTPRWLRSSWALSARCLLRQSRQWLRYGCLAAQAALAQARPQRLRRLRVAHSTAAGARAGRGVHPRHDAGCAPAKRHPGRGGQRVGGDARVAGHICRAPQARTRAHACVLAWRLVCCVPVLTDAASATAPLRLAPAARNCWRSSCACSLRTASWC
jgi:hypothetical protein